MVANYAGLRTPRLLMATHEMLWCVTMVLAWCASAHLQSPRVRSLCFAERDRLVAARASMGGVLFVIRGEAFRNGHGQKTVHTCCNSSVAAQRAIFETHKAFLDALEARGYGRARVVSATYACSRGAADLPETLLRRWYAPWLSGDARDWVVRPHAAKGYTARDRANMAKLGMPAEHLADLGNDGGVTQRDVVVGLLARVAEILQEDARRPPALVVVNRWDTTLAVRNWTLFDACVRDGPTADYGTHDVLDVIPGEFAPCFASWDDVHETMAAGALVSEMRAQFGLGGEQRCANQPCACIRNVATFKKNGECLEDDSFPQHASYAQARVT